MYKRKITKVGKVTGEDKGSRGTKEAKEGSSFVAAEDRHIDSRRR